MGQGGKEEEKRKKETGTKKLIMFLKLLISKVKCISSSPVETKGVEKVTSFPPIFHKFHSLPTPSKCFYKSVKRHVGGSQAIGIQLAFSTTVFSLQIKNYAVSIVT